MDGVTTRKLRSNSLRISDATIQQRLTASSLTRSRTTRLLVSAAAALLVIAQPVSACSSHGRSGSKHDVVLGALSVAMALGLELVKTFRDQLRIHVAQAVAHHHSGRAHARRATRRRVQSSKRADLHEPDAR